MILEKKAKITRYDNMDLFRVLMMLFVIGHHYLKRAHPSMHVLSLNNSTYYLLTHLFIIGVNGFILMSGYFLCKKEFNISRIINLLIWLSIYSCGLYTVFSLLGYGSSFMWRKFVTAFLPGNWWFMFPYVALLLISPFLNTLIKNLNVKQYQLLLLSAFFIEVFWSSTFSSSEIDRQDGYSLYNFIFLYLLGAHFRVHNYKIKLNRVIFVFISLILVSSITHYLLAFPLRDYDIFYFRNRFYDYNFITVFLCSLSIFLIFININFSNKYIRKLRPFVLSAYLIHSHPNVGAFLFENFLNNKNYPNCEYILIRVIVFCLVTFFCSVLIDSILRRILQNLITKVSSYIEVLSNNAYIFIEKYSPKPIEKTE